jgi:colanic acid/amylovoran biosynthesis glycosyltransferase
LFRHSADSYRAVFDRADVAIAVSSYCGQRLTALGCNPNKIAYIPFGVDLQHFAYARRPVRQPREAIKLVSVGRLVRDKGFHIGIDAVSQLVDKYNLTYTIVGGGSEHSRLQSQIVEQGLQDRIFLVGVQDHDALVKILQGSHICIAPSITTKLGSQEPYGVMIREAAATGCPVIASDIGGLSEGVISEETGLLIPENDTSALCEAIVRMMSWEPRWEDIGLRGRRLMEEMCDLKESNNRFIEAFE